LCSHEAEEDDKEKIYLLEINIDTALRIIQKMKEADRAARQVLRL
jgi:hypothetical protein